MKRVFAPLLCTLALAACSDTSPSRIAAPDQLRAPGAPYFSKGTTGIDGDYIVVFKDDVVDALSKADAKVLKHGATAKFTYDKAIKGFAATMAHPVVAHH